MCRFGSIFLSYSVTDEKWQGRIRTDSWLQKQFTTKKRSPCSLAKHTNVFLCNRQISQGQKRITRGMFWEISFSRNLFFAFSRKQTEFHLSKMGRAPCWSADNLKTTSSPWVIYLNPRYSLVTLVSGYLFDSCQLTITWMSNTKLNADSIERFHMTSRRP